jgi:hypothetical protein
MSSNTSDANLLSPALPSVPAPSSIHSPGPSSLPSTSYPSQALAALETYKKKDASKVVVRFKAIGNAPIMKNNYFRITAFNRFQAVIQFLRKELGWKQGDALVSMSCLEEAVLLRRTGNSLPASFFSFYTSILRLAPPQMTVWAISFV